MPEKTTPAAGGSAVSDSEEDEAHYSDEEGGIRVEGIYIPPAPIPYCSIENKGPRLIITKITNNFFKSYAEQQVLGPFNKCFNAIVGPNGSGKSNVIDSMLFVFGYRASKIRSKKLSVLLHNSQKYRHVQSCTVAVHFAEIIDKDGDDYDIVPGSEFYVSRTAHKDNSSFYTLDGKKTVFKEIGTLLKKHGIDLDHNRFLILQGEVEQISLMPPKGTESDPGMLEFLEDIIGTTRYKKPLQQLHQSVETLSERRSEKINRLKLVEKELEALDGPKSEAVQFLKVENQIMTTRNILFQKKIFMLEDNKQTNQEEIEPIQSRQNEIKETLSGLDQEKKEKSALLSKASKTHEELDKRKDGLKEAFAKAHNKDINLQTSMTEINKNRKKTKELIIDEQKLLEGYLRTPQETENSLKELKKLETQNIPKKEALDAEKVHLLANLQSETKELQESKEAIQTELGALNKIVDETNSAYTVADFELKMCKSVEEKEKTKLELMQRAFESAQTSIQQQTTEVAKLQAQVPQTEKALLESTNELQNLKIQDVQIMQEIRTKRSTVEESRATMNASNSRGKVLSALMRQKIEGNCPGIFGRLGDLGAIDQKYDVAVSTACGPLDNIVVDTVNTAEWCIEFLKKNDIGRSSFIALEKQQHLLQQCNTPITTPENVPRLFDQIRVEDERVRPAFYYALRNTLVANTLDQASRIAYGAQRYRVVTLNGDLIETSGTMSGGGKRQARGRMGSRVTVSNVNVKDLEKMEVDLQQLEQQLREVRQRQSALEVTINNLTPQLRQMKIALEKYTIELKSLKQNQPTLANQLKSQEKKANETKADPIKVKQLTATANGKKSEYDEALANATVLQTKVDALTKEIKEKTLGRVQALDKKIREVVKSIDKCKSESNKLIVGLKTAERNAEKSNEKIATMEQDVKTAETSLRAMRAQRDEIEEDAQKLLTCIEEIETNMEEEGEEYSGIKEEVNQINKKEMTLKSEKIEVDHKIKTFDELLNQINTKIHQFRTKLTQLKYHEIPDETLPVLKTFTKEELENYEYENIQRELEAYEAELKSAKPNLTAIQEYTKKQRVFVERANELDEVTIKRRQMRTYYEMLHTRRKEEFIAGFSIIKMKLKEMYQLITLGGDADLEMLDTFDPFSEGVIFRVRPPRKTWKIISNLSGGEKTLSSLSLVFALHYYKPSPLYVMDEIDAALDFKNVSIVGNYIKERTKNAQFIIISLRSNMFELCDYLIGIYKIFNCTKSMAIDPRKFDKKKKQDQVVPTNPIVPTEAIATQETGTELITNVSNNDIEVVLTANTDDMDESDKSIESQIDDSNSGGIIDDSQMEAMSVDETIIENSQE